MKCRLSLFSGTLSLRAFRRQVFSGRRKEDSEFTYTTQKYYFSITGDVKSFDDYTAA